MVRVRWVALAPLLGVLLAGCSSEEPPQPAPLPSAPVPASPTPSAEPTPAAASPTSEGASAFVRLYYETLRTSLIEGNPAAIERLASPTCEACQAMIEVVEREAEAGTRYSGGEITDFLAEAVEDEPGRFGVIVKYSSQPYQQTRAGSTPTTVPGADGASLEATVQSEGGTWRMLEITAIGGDR